MDVTASTAQIERPDRQNPAVPNPAPVDLNSVQFEVLTEKTLPSTDGWVYYGLTPKDYETLAKNMAEILRWVQEAQWRLDYYRGKAGPKDDNAQETE